MAEKTRLNESENKNITYFNEGITIHYSKYTMFSQYYTTKIYHVSMHNIQPQIVRGIDDPEDEDDEDVLLESPSPPTSF